jgi:hypothetical protein
MTRRLPLSLIVITGLLAACSLEDALPHPDCVAGGSGLIVAQSVPRAELVPCLGPIPDGWSIESVTVDQDGSTLWLDSDRAGDGAARLLYRPECPLDGAVAVPTDHSGALAFEQVERIRPGFRADRVYVFGGGCVRWEFDFDPGASATLSIELRNALTLMPRSVLNDSIRETFIDEEL